jgi:5-carboxymethyl-2-hydroxymuconate isomerase
VCDAGPAPATGFVPDEEGWRRIAAADGPAHSPDDIRLLAPLRPPKILCVGRNYREHAAEMAAAPPEAPLIFAKLTSAVIGPGEPIVIPREDVAIDFEAELAIVLGRRVRRVEAVDALAAVGGYTAMNDVTARTLQRGDGQWTRGKGYDTFAPLGPAVASPDELDPAATTVRSLLSGELMQDGTTADLIFPVAELVAYVSAFCTLEPGDLIATGTPAGVGAGRTPPRWLRPGDVVEVDVAGVGALRNPVVGEGPSS